MSRVRGKWGLVVGLLVTGVLILAVMRDRPADLGLPRFGEDLIPAQPALRGRSLIAAGQSLTNP